MHRDRCFASMSKIPKRQWDRIFGSRNEECFTCGAPTDGEIFCPTHEAQAKRRWSLERKDQ